MSNTDENVFQTSPDSLLFPQILGEMCCYFSGLLEAEEQRKLLHRRELLCLRLLIYFSGTDTLQAPLSP